MASDFYGEKMETNSKSLSSRKTVRVKAGDIVTFGRYPQTASGEIEPLEWRVLVAENDVALLITKKCIDCKPYNEDDKHIKWENCTLREWMNSDFINEAFDMREQRMLIAAMNSNSGNLWCEVSGCADTQDKIFALSIDEAEEYFADDESRMAHVTEYAKANECFLNEKLGTSQWWLRSPGCDTNKAANVYSYGGIHSCGYDVDFNFVCIRPACRVRLLSLP